MSNRLLRGTMLSWVTRSVSFGGLLSGINVLAAISILIIMLATSADISHRYITGRSIPGILEISEYLLVAVVFLALPYTQRVGGNIKIEVLTSRLGGLPRVIVQVFTLSASLGICALLTWKTANQAIAATLIQEYRWGIIAIPLWPARILLPLGFFLLSVQLLLQIMQAARR